MDEVGGFTWHKKAEDLHCWLKVLFAGYKIYRLGEYYAYRRMHNNSWSSMDINCSKEVLELIVSLKANILENGMDYYRYFNRWAKKNIIINNKNRKHLNIREGIKYINGFEANYFPFRFILDTIKRKLESKR